MGHVVLLGDSIFDNALYVPRGGDVLTSLRQVLPLGWRADLAARDGAVAADVASQLDRMPAGATHLIVSAGGNDALRESALLRERASSIAEALMKLAAAQDRFRRDYRAMLDEVTARRLPTAICTIYDPNFPYPDEQRIAATALASLNDVITREAVLRGLPVIDLRVIFSAAADYANAIEPSTQGGEKLARAIASLLGANGFDTGRAVLVRD